MNLSLENPNAEVNVAALVSERDELRSELSEALGKIEELQSEVSVLRARDQSAEQRAIELMATVGQGQGPAAFQGSEFGQAQTITERCLEANATRVKKQR